MTTEEIVLPGRGWRTDLHNGSIFFVGTATTIIRYGGVTILTDPNFLHAGDPVHLGYGLRSKRLTQPAMEIDELPKLDLVVLSHMHEDHFDRVAAERLARQVPIVSAPDAVSKLSHTPSSSLRWIISSERSRPPDWNSRCATWRTGRRTAGKCRAAG
jgi:glyoxylase-like metal-dependent hydrolase (beta-lactamase superfamily II)